MTELEKDIDLILNKLVAKTYGLPVDDLPPNLGITSPSLDIAQTKQAILDLIQSEVRKELELLQQIDFSPTEPDELPSMTLDEYLQDRIAQLDKGKK